MLGHSLPRPSPAGSQRHMHLVGTFSPTSMLAIHSDLYYTPSDSPAVARAGSLPVPRPRLPAARRRPAAHTATLPRLRVYEPAPAGRAPGLHQDAGEPPRSAQCGTAGTVRSRLLPFTLVRESDSLRTQEIHFSRDPGRWYWHYTDDAAKASDLRGSDAFSSSIPPRSRVRGSTAVDG